MQYNNKLVTCYEQGSVGVYLMQTPEGRYLVSSTDGCVMYQERYDIAEDALLAYHNRCEEVNHVE